MNEYRLSCVKWFVVMVGLVAVEVAVSMSSLAKGQIIAFLLGIAAMKVLLVFKNMHLFAETWIFKFLLVLVLLLGLYFLWGVTYDLAFQWVG